MNCDMMNRVKEAKKYQMKAWMALFPESSAQHFEVIGNEISAMFMECAADMMKKERYSSDDKRETKEKQDGFCKEEKYEANCESKEDAKKNSEADKTKKKSKVRKVTIE